MCFRRREISEMQREPTAIALTAPCSNPSPAVHRPAQRSRRRVKHSNPLTELSSEAARVLNQ